MLVQDDNMSQVLEQLEGSAAFQRRVYAAREDKSSQDDVIVTPRTLESPSEAEPGPHAMPHGSEDQLPDRQLGGTDKASASIASSPKSEVSSIETDAQQPVSQKVLILLRLRTVDKPAPRFGLLNLLVLVKKFAGRRFIWQDVSCLATKFFRRHRSPSI